MRTKPGTAESEQSLVARAATGRTGGQALTATERAFFEPRFGTDFSEVRLHTGRPAAQSAHALQARAYTIGPDIVFGHGEYQPSAQEGRRLLAHELAHVLQQRNGEQVVSRQLGIVDFPHCSADITGVDNPTERIEEARVLSIAMVDSAIAALAHEANGGGNAGTAAIQIFDVAQDPISVHFHDPMPAEIQTAIANYRRIRARLQLRTRIICNTQGSSICRRGSEGYAWVGIGPYIHLCPTSLDPSEGAPLHIILIHEAAHVAGVEDNCYQWEDCYSTQTSAAAIDNADSYAFYADAVHIQIN